MLKKILGIVCKEAIVFGVASSIGHQFLNKNSIWVLISGICVGFIAFLLPEKWLPKFKRNRISLRSLRGIASSRSWDMTGKNNLLVMDFLDELRQGAIDNKIIVWGRKDEFGLVGKHDFSMVRDEPLIKIPNTHFYDFDIDVGGFCVFESNRYNVTTRMGVSSPTEGGFSDLHVEIENPITLIKSLERAKGRRDSRNKLVMG